MSVFEVGELIERCLYALDDISAKVICLIGNKVAIYQLSKEGAEKLTKTLENLTISIVKNRNKN